MALVFHRVVSVEDALRHVEEAVGGVKPLGVEEVELLKASGRVLAEDVEARVDSPPFDRSTVDGYAVNAQDVYAACEAEPVSLKVVGSARVGRIPEKGIRVGECMEIATGAPLPPGANAVVMVEYTKREGDRVLVYRAVAPGENVSQTGSDVTAGDIVLRKGRRLTPRDIAVLAALGYGKVKVYVRPRAAVFSTGDELLPPSSKLTAGKVYDVNGYSVTSMLRELGVEAEFHGILPDDYEEMRSAVSQALRSHDLVVTSGSTSAGFGDAIYKVFNEVGGVLIHGLKLKPGKPTVLGATSGGKLLIGLPGFPLSAMMAFMTVVEPLLRKMLGLKEERRSRTLRALIPMRLEAGKGKRHLIPVQLVESKSGLSAYPILLDSGAASALMLADGFIEVPENKQYLEEDEAVEVRLFGDFKPPSISIIGSHCPGLDVLLSIAELWDAKLVNVGSTAGWRALKRGEADVAGTHLLDEETMTYNLHMPRRMRLEDEVEIYGGYLREIGFVVAHGNPKNIKSFKDLLKPGIVFVNRVKGSGIRTFIDINLRKLGVKDPEKSIKGYVYEAKTHTAVAAAVAHGRADVGVAVGYVAKLYGLDFIPLAEEHYDIAVRKDRLRKTGVQKFLETLRNPAFQKELERLPHYRIHESTGKRIYP